MKRGTVSMTDSATTAAEKLLAQVFKRTRPSGATLDEVGRHFEDFADRQTRKLRDQIESARNARLDRDETIATLRRRVKELQAEIMDLRERAG